MIIKNGEVQMKFRDDFENMTEEEIERQENVLDIIHGEMNREKTMTYAPDAPKRIKSVVGYIESLLHGEDFEYKINYERCEIFGSALYIVAEVPIIGGNPRTHWNFQRLVDNVDAFEIKWQPTGRFRMEFRLNGVFKEVR